MHLTSDEKVRAAVGSARLLFGVGSNAIEIEIAAFVNDWKTWARFFAPRRTPPENLWLTFAYLLLEIPSVLVGTQYSLNLLIDVQTGPP